MRDSASEQLKDGLLSLDMEATLMAANTVIKANDKATVNDGGHLVRKRGCYESQACKIWGTDENITVLFNTT